MRVTLLFVAAGLASSVCFAQELCRIPKRGPSAAAVAAFEKIQDAVGIAPGAILLFASTDPLVQNSSGAVSVECPGGRGDERWIVLDPELIKGDALYFALAHEMAHHLNNDPMSGEAPSKQAELRADSFAARVLARPPLNWTSEKLLQALSTLPLPKEASGNYPSIEERRTQVTESFRAESVRVTQPTPQPEPVKESRTLAASAEPPARPASEPAPVKATQNPSPPPPSLAAGTKQTNPKDGLVYVWMPPGKFSMGCSPGDNECSYDEIPAHDVTMTKGFWIGQTEVTQEAYRRIIGSDPSHFKGATLPVESINWNDANAYCRAIGGRLPGEAEWEYAARAGSTSSRYGDIDQVAWYLGTSRESQKVAQKAPNAWGLYDMLGNVFEWTADRPEAGLPSGKTGPIRQSSDTVRVVRGGSWDSTFRAVRSSFRAVGFLDSASPNIGLRCVADFLP